MSNQHSPTPEQAIPLASIQAMLNRYKASMLVCALRGFTAEFYRSQGHAQALSDLISHSESAAFAAKTDASIGGHQPLGGFEAAWAALPMRFEMLTLAQVKEVLASTGTQWPGDEIANSQIDSTQQLESGKVAVANLGDKHDAPGAKLNDDALLHSASLGEAAIVAEGGAA